MSPASQSCPLCGRSLGPGEPNEVLDRHFRDCEKTDDRQAPRREWDLRRFLRGFGRRGTGGSMG